MSAASGRPRARGQDSAVTADRAIVAAKLAVPRPPDWIVPRARIDKLISAGARGPVTVLTGPPGAGKTVALASWAHRPGAGPVAWVTLDSYDGRPATFWSHVAEALRRAGVTALPPGGCRQPRTAVGYVRRLAVGLADLDRDVTLVLDDLHHVSAVECLDGVEYLARYVGRLHVVVASRMDPLLHLQRLRVAGQLTEIRARDLAFTSGEAAELLRRHGIELPGAAVGRLTQRSEGWAAGLRLAALAMREHPDPETVADRFAAADGPVTGYLVTEVLDRQPPEVRRLMLITSVPDRLCSDLAAELSGGAAPAATLPALARANAFVQPTGDGWYRYYPPLAEVLRLKLQEEYPHEVRSLRLRAARWLHRNGCLDEAVELAAGGTDDWAIAAGMVVDDLLVGQLIGARGGERLADALASPPPPRRTDPCSLVVAAALRTRWHRDDEAASLLAGADRALARLPAAAELPARLSAAMVALELARRSGALAAALAAADQARGLLGRMPASLLESRAAARAQLLSEIGLVDMWAGRFGDAVAALELSVVAGDGSGRPAGGSAILALVEAVRGRLSHARTLAAAARGGGAQDAAAAAVALAWVRLEQGELALARTELTHAERALDARPDRLVGALAHVVAARYRLARGQPRAAAEIAGADRAAWAPPAWLGQLLAAAEVRALTQAGDTRRALAAAGDGGDAELAPAVAEAWLASGDQVRARQAITRAKAASARRGWRGSRVEAELAGARLAYVSGDPAAGRQSVRAALRMAQPEQMRLPFTLERAWLQPMLRQDARLAEEFRLSFAGGPSRHAVQARTEPLVVEQLSGREREVLGYASQMLSTAEIAEEMYLSVNTVKSHLRTILRKLGAGHRREAVRRARELQLL